MHQTIKDMLERRSVREFKQDSVEKELIEQVVEAGLYAASAMGKQGTRIVVVTNRELRDKIMEDNRKIGGWKEGFDPFYGAPVIVIVLGEKASDNRVYDGSLVLGNMMLAAHVLGLGTCWIHRARQEFEMEEYQELLKKLGIEGEFEGIGHLALGYPKGELSKPAPRKENHVFYAD